MDRLVVDIATQCEALLAQRGHGPEAHADDVSSDGDDALPLIQSASVAGRSAVRDRPAARRVQLRGGRPHRLPPLCASAGGYSMHAGVVRGPETGRLLAGLERAARGPPLRDVGAAGA